MKINVLNYIIKAMPKDLKHEIFKLLFLDPYGHTGFDIKDEELMNDLQKIVDNDECTLIGDIVYAEVDLDQGLYSGFILYGNYTLEEDIEGDVEFSVNKEGYVFGVEYSGF